VRTPPRTREPKDRMAQRADVAARLHPEYAAVATAANPGGAEVRYNGCADGVLDVRSKSPPVRAGDRRCRSVSDISRPWMARELLGSGRLVVCPGCC
jgi:hypothetical protein